MVSPPDAPGLLFDVGLPELPDGLRYRRDFITPDEEARLLEAIARVEFSTFEMHGVAARRRVAFFGGSYNTGGADSAPFPEFLLPLRARIAEWAGLDAEAFAMALINAYPPGAPIGWHRDAPQYAIVAGVSLLSECVMKFRPYVWRNTRSSATESASASDSPPRRRVATHEITLDRRSAYLMTGDSRSKFEHHIPPVTTQRYSITFRTLRSNARDTREDRRDTRDPRHETTRS